MGIDAGNAGHGVELFVGKVAALGKFGHPFGDVILRAVECLHGTGLREGSWVARAVALDGADGFRVVAPVGESLNLGSKNNVAAAGDFNGDGLDDFVIGARAGGNPDNAGQVYIIFGSTSAFDATMDLDDLSFNQGFQVLNDGGGFFGSATCF